MLSQIENDLNKSDCTKFAKIVHGKLSNYEAKQILKIVLIKAIKTQNNLKTIHQPVFTSYLHVMNELLDNELLHMGCDFRRWIILGCNKKLARKHLNDYDPVIRHCLKQKFQNEKNGYGLI